MNVEIVVRTVTALEELGVVTNPASAFRVAETFEPGSWRTYFHSLVIEHLIRILCRELDVGAPSVGGHYAKEEHALANLAKDGVEELKNIFMLARYFMPR